MRHVSIVPSPDAPDMVPAVMIVAAMPLPGMTNVTFAHVVVWLRIVCTTLEETEP